MKASEHAGQAGQARKYELLSKEASKRGLNTANFDKRAAQARAAAKKK